MGADPNPGIEGRRDSRNKRTVRLLLSRDRKSDNIARASIFQ